jgi:hypothetical protein
MNNALSFHSLKNYLTNIILLQNIGVLDWITGLRIFARIGTWSDPRYGQKKFQISGSEDVILSTFPSAGFLYLNLTSCVALFAVIIFLPTYAPSLQPIYPPLSASKAAPTPPNIPISPHQRT